MSAPLTYRLALCDGCRRELPRADEAHELERAAQRLLDAYDRTGFGVLEEINELRAALAARLAGLPAPVREEEESGDE